MDTYQINWIDMVIYNKVIISSYIVHYKSGVIRRYTKATATIDEYIKECGIAEEVHETENIYVLKYKKQDQ